MAQMTCQTVIPDSPGLGRYCTGEAKFCEYCMQQAQKKVRADELRRIAEDPTTKLFGLSLNYIRRLLEKDQERKCTKRT